MGRRFYRARPVGGGAGDVRVMSARRAADTKGRMLELPPKMSNTERQRLFREPNPGYYRRLHAKGRAAMAAAWAQRLATQEAVAELPEPPAAPVVAEIPGDNAIQ